MTPTDNSAAGSLMKMALGFLVGLAVIPAAIFFTRPQADEVSDTAFNQSPREVRYDLIEEVSAMDRYDERVLVGSSIMDRGFRTQPGGSTARFALRAMRVEETTEIIQNLMRRPRPPKTIIVDWSALHDIPHQYLGQQSTPAYFSVDYLLYALKFRLADRGEPERRGNATWATPVADGEFSEGNIEKFLTFGALFAQFSKLPDFVKDLGDMCQGTGTRFTIVRFPIFYKGNESQTREYIKSRDTADYQSMLDSVECDVEFVDLLAESMDGTGRRYPFQTDQKQWFDFNHFRPSVGEQLLADPRFGGTQSAPDLTPKGALTNPL